MTLTPAGHWLLLFAHVHLCDLGLLWSAVLVGPAGDHIFVTMTQHSSGLSLASLGLCL